MFLMQATENYKVIEGLFQLLSGQSLHKNRANV